MNSRGQTKTELAGAALLVALAVGGVAAIVEGVSADPLPKDVKTLTQATVDGEITGSNVYRVERPDGGVVYLAQLKDGGGQFLDHSPCAKRPTGVKATDCQRKMPDGGIVEQGDENVMQAGQWQGPGCVEVACVIVSGDPDP